MSDTENEPRDRKTTSDDSEDRVGLVDPSYLSDTPLGVDDPNIALDGGAGMDDGVPREWTTVEDDEATREWRTDHTEYGEDARYEQVKGLINPGNVDGIDELTDNEGEMLADTGDLESSPEAAAMHIVEDDDQ